MSRPADGRWVIGGASALGAAHARRGQPNQDALGWVPKAVSTQFAVAVSDGHGAPAHYRSQIGARLAVEAALSVLDWFLGAEPSETEAASLAWQIVAAWRKAVFAHAAVHPPAEGWVEAAEDMLLPYGATLVALASREDALIALQIGDGDLLLGYRDGRIERPLPDDAGLVGEQTHSLCAPDAPSHARVALLRRASAAAWPDFVLLATDGVSKSFADEDAFRDVARHYAAAVRAGDPQVVHAQLEGWLADVSRRGSGDDVTLCLASRHGETEPGA